jgi:hypothetical protein
MHSIFRLKVTNNYYQAVSYEFEAFQNGLIEYSADESKTSITHGIGGYVRIPCPARQLRYHLLSISQLDLAQLIDFGAYHWVFGDFTATPDDFRYQLPLLGPVFITKGYQNTDFSIELVPDSSDYCMGHPVVAVRDGTVVYANFNASLTCPFSQSNSCIDYVPNMVRIVHADNTVGVYMHQAFTEEAPVAVGDRVVEGTGLGVCGNTGFTLTSLLHFEVETMAAFGVYISHDANYTTHCDDSYVPQVSSSYPGWSKRCEANYISIFNRAAKGAQRTWLLFLPVLFFDR